MNNLLKSNKISEFQKVRINKSMYQSIYLLDVKYIDSIVELTITGSTLNIYTVKIIDLNIYCNCPDIKFTSCFCKHICFVLCIIGKLYNENLFIIKKLCPIEKENILLILRNIHKDPQPDIINSMLIEKYNKINFIPRNLEDECPICYISFKKEDKLYSCVKCLNCVHKECMKMWLKNKKNCVFCRSEIIDIEYDNIAK
jgi:uncharacterized Zn finger protein